MIAVDHGQVAAFADFFRDAADVKAFDFCHTPPPAIFPPAHAPGILDYVFFNAGHQFGFWLLEHDRYAGPMLAVADVHSRKGSDYVSYCLTRAWRKNHRAFAPAMILEMDWNDVFSDDSGRNPLPLWEEHRSIIARYAQWFADRGTTPIEIVTRANAAERPLAHFLAEAGSIPGYAEDSLRKKLFLLAIMLENRPEKFLRVTDPESYEPIIDYHLQRSALRAGLVRIEDADVRAALIARRVVPAEVEGRIRQAVFEAIREVVHLSGRSVAAVDYFFFMNRRRCPEMTPPDCEHCPVQDICAREVDLFQPVFRTTAY